MIEIGKRGKFNNYKVIGDKTIIYMMNRNKERFETIINTKHLQRLIDLNYSWHVAWREGNQSYYVQTTIYLGIIDGKPKYQMVYLHKLLTNTSKNEIVDHKNHNTLDNTDDNFRITIKDKNCKHRETKNVNNKSGYRNVCWIDDYNKWCVQLQVDGKNTMLGKFDDVDEAGAFAEEMRNEIYGEFRGGN